MQHTSMLFSTIILLLSLEPGVVSCGPLGEYDEKKLQIENHYYYGYPQQAQYGYAPPAPAPQFAQNGYYQNPYYYQQSSSNENPSQRQPQQRNRQQNRCGSKSAPSVMDLLSKVSTTKKHLDNLSTHVKALVVDMFKRPIEGVMEIPQTVYDGFSSAISVSKDLQGAVQYAHCAGPSFKQAIVQSVKALDGSRHTLLMSSSGVKAGGPLGPLKNLVNEVEGLVSQAVREIFVMVTDHSSGSDSGSGSGSDSSDGSTDDAQTSDPYAAFSDYGSSSTSSTDPYGAFSAYADPTTAASQPQDEETPPTQCTPVMRTTTVEHTTTVLHTTTVQHVATVQHTTTIQHTTAPQHAIYTTDATFRFTITESVSGHTSPKIFTLTTQKVYTFANLAKRAASNERTPVKYNGIDTGDGDPGDDDEGKYSYIGDGYNWGNENGEGSYSGSKTDTPYESHSESIPNIPSSSSAPFSTNAIFPHASISFVQHVTEIPKTK